MAGRTDLLDLDPHRVLIAIHPDLDHALGLARALALAPQRIARAAEVPALAGRDRGADYGLVVTVTKNGWKYTAHAILIDCRTRELVMDFRSEYFDPKKETLDRGRRIARTTLEKIEILLRSSEDRNRP